LTKLADGITVKELHDYCGSDADNVCGLVNSLEIIENSCVILDAVIRVDNAHYIDGRPVAYDAYMGHDSEGYYLEGQEDVGGRGKVVRTYLKMDETVRML
jgi:hypothetical protein